MTEADVVEIDGSFGEGGGQILRSSLTLSVVTGRRLHISNIRGRRAKGGLRAQHLQSVRAAAEISGARVVGDEIGSSELAFEPGPVRPGKYRFDIGTAGATSLVLQTIALPLALAAKPSRIVITGGTHVPWAPCFHYLDMQWRPCLGQMGVTIGLDMQSAGYYPRGGGQIVATVEPSSGVQPLALTRRGELKLLRCFSAVSHLPTQIAERQAHRAERRLLERELHPTVTVTELPSIGPGTVLLLLAEFEGGRACYFGLGEIRKKAERVAEEAAEGLLRFLDADATVDEYAADQMLLPAALATGTSEFSTPVVTEHLLTHAEVIRRFTAAEVAIDGEPGKPGRVTVKGKQQ